MVLFEVACCRGCLQLSLKHDTARVIQCCLKFGSPEQRTIVFTELKGARASGSRGWGWMRCFYMFYFISDHILELAKVTYSKFIVKALLKYW